MTAHFKAEASAKREVDIENATAELCALVVAIGELSGPEDMKNVCGFLLNIANVRAREIVGTWR
jgi:hypothetical protein